jgi:hypothetical protein
LYASALGNATVERRIDVLHVHLPLHGPISVFVI